jgi:hypothetical protein
VKLVTLKVMRKKKKGHSSLGVGHWVAAILAICITLNACSDPVREKNTTFIESKPSFYELRHGEWTASKWIRKPEHLLMIHETFKKFGYLHLISEDLLSNTHLLVHGIYIRKRGEDLLDSLEITYGQPEIKEKYYREFWQRRKSEKNDSIVHIIISEINTILRNKNLSGRVSSSHTEMVNDTLIELLKIEFRKDSLTRELADRDLNTLVRLGFHQSAYNVLYERGQYDEFKWNKDSAEHELIPSKTFIDPWFEDNTK